MTQNQDEVGQISDSGEKAVSPLRAVSRLVDSTEALEPAPTVRLRREFKGLTVADLHNGEIAACLPGQVRSALNHIERGELDAAERALPGQFANVLAGPGHRRRQRRRFRAVSAGLAVLVAAAVASWLSY